METNRVKSNFLNKIRKTCWGGTSLAVRRLRLHASRAGAEGQRSRPPRAAWCRQKPPALCSGSQPWTGSPHLPPEEGCFQAAQVTLGRLPAPSDLSPSLGWPLPSVSGAAAGPANRPPRRHAHGTEPRAPRQGAQGLGRPGHGRRATARLATSAPPQLDRRKALTLCFPSTVRGWCRRRDVWRRPRGLHRPQSPSRGPHCPILPIAPRRPGCPNTGTPALTSGIPPPTRSHSDHLGSGRRRFLLSNAAPQTPRLAFQRLPSWVPATDEVKRAERQTPCAQSLGCRRGGPGRLSRDRSADQASRRRTVAAGRGDGAPLPAHRAPGHSMGFLPRAGVRLASG